jgi:tetratricopeptide (TPR) repeat protein
MPDNEAESNPAEVLMSFLNATGGSARVRILRAHPELLSPRVDDWLANVAAVARTEDPVWAETIERARAYLRRCRSGGQREPLPPDAVITSIPDHLVNAWEALTRAHSTRVDELVRQHPELVGQEFGEWLRSAHADAQGAGNYAFSAWLQDWLDAFDGFRIGMAAIVLERTEGTKVSDVLLEGIHNLVAASSWSACSPVIAETPQLLTDDADLLCRKLVEVARALGDEEAVATYYANWTFLKTCRSHGLVHGIASFTDWAGVVPDHIAIGYTRTKAIVSSALLSSDLLAVQAALADVESLLSHPDTGPAPRALITKMLTSQALLLMRITELSGDSGGAEAAIEELESAHECLPDNAPDQLACLANLGSALQYRFRQNGNLDDLRRAANCLASAADVATPFSPERQQVMALATDLLTDLAQRTGEAEPLDQLIDLQLEDLRYCRPMPAQEAERALAVSFSLERRYDLTGEEASLLAMIDLSARTADKVGQVPQLAALLDRAGFGLIRQYGNSGDPADLDRALVSLQAAVAAAEPGSFELSVGLDHWGCALRDRYARYGDGSDLDLAIELAEQAFHNAPNVAGKGAFAPTNLGNALMDRYSATGNERDLNRAIELYEQAASIPSGEEEQQRLSSLAVSFMTRHYRTGDLTDLDAAISLFRQVLDVVPNRSSDRLKALNNLAMALRDRYNRISDSADLDQAVDLFERVIAEEPSRAVLHASHLGNLAMSLMDRRNSDTARPDDLDTAIQVWEEAVALTERGSPSYYRLIANLGGALIERERSRGQPDQSGDVSRAIEMLTVAVDATETGTPEWAARMGNLAAAFRIRSQGAKGSTDLDRAIDIYGRACAASLGVAPGTVLELGWVWSTWAVTRNSWAEAAQAANYGLTAMYRLFRAQLGRREKEIWLRKATGISTVAAYAAAAAGDLRDAVTAFESGRALILNEILDLDSANVSTLAASGCHDLAERYRSAAEHWHELSHHRERLD